MTHRPRLIRTRDLPEADPYREGAMTRVARGVVVPTEVWRALDPAARRRTRVRAQLLMTSAPGIVSHQSAAALWDLPEIGEVDDRLHLVDEHRDRTHSGPNVVRHPARGTSTPITTRDGVVVTSLLRTVLDVITSVRFDQAVVVLDHVLHQGTLTEQQILDALRARPATRGVRVAAEAVAFADGRSETVGESLSRLVMRRLGVPGPCLQHEFTTDLGRVRVDFWWPEQGVAGEFDGRVKYRTGGIHPEGEAGVRAVEELVWREKRREDALRRHQDVRTVARWGMADLHDERRFAMILRSAGLAPLML